MTRRNWWRQAQCQLSLRHILIDGTVLSTVLGTAVLAIAAHNAEIMHDDYPPAVLAQARPMSERSKRERLLVTPPFLATLFGGLLASTLALKRHNDGQVSFLAAFLHTYAVFVFANAFDLIVMDWGVLLGLKPAFGKLPGADDWALYMDYGFHFVAFLKGLVIGFVPSLLIAWGTSHRWH